ncbi:hypothetical protein BP6252_03385 [Coleophoma cylindrospora]|uniref:Uncharacterized protein n=1 Tax=Coleophoma cylindrospora TaxID=1849047 RepID=A0A3D8S7J8_9HELO|nr:hypothetical protein BP6252_03385 [Coleophoma cylindrospora]
MTEATNTKLMDTEAGGEQTQYEGANTFTTSHANANGQINDRSTTQTSDQAQQEKSARGEKTAENMRYGQAISEHGFGGETTNNNGHAQQGGYGRVEAQEVDATQSRREQGYGGGSGVGA